METFTEDTSPVEEGTCGTADQSAEIPRMHGRWAKIREISGGMLSSMLTGDGARVADGVREARLRSMGYDNYPGPHAM